MRLAVVSTHPIQYNAPLFRAVAAQQDIDLRVFYSWKGTANQPDPEFGHPIDWDIPLVAGYDHEFVPNVAKAPGTHHFFGLNNPRMIAQITGWNPDVVLVYGWAWRTHLEVMRHFKGRVPLLFRGDSTLLSGSRRGLKRWLRVPVLHWVYQHVDLALTPGIRNTEYLKAMGLDPSRIVPVPHAIDVRRFADKIHRQRADKERVALGIGHDAIVYGFAGKLIPRKQCGLLIDAYKQVNESIPHAHLLIVGEGPDRERLVAQAANHPNIRFLGFRNQEAMPAAYRISDVHILPSSIETWGLGVNEAMASGRAMIVSDRVGAAPDLVAGQPYGRVFDSGSATDLSDKMMSLPDTRKEILELGAKAGKAANAFSMEAVAERLSEVVRACAVGSQMPQGQNCR